VINNNISINKNKKIKNTNSNNKVNSENISTVNSAKSTEGAINPPNITPTKTKIINNNTTVNIQQNKKLNVISIKNAKPREKEVVQSVEFALPEIHINKNQRIENYFPYFYKTHIINLPNNSNYIPSFMSTTVSNVNILSSPCLQPNCISCSLNNQATCSICKHGYFLYNNQCLYSCPNGYAADIFRRQCNPITYSGASKI
jgi:hypothetical protein